MGRIIIEQDSIREMDMDEPIYRSNPTFIEQPKEVVTFIPPEPVKKTITPSIKAAKPVYDTGTKVTNIASNVVKASVPEPTLIVNKTKLVQNFGTTGANNIIGDIKTGNPLPANVASTIVSKKIIVAKQELTTPIAKKLVAKKIVKVAPTIDRPLTNTRIPVRVAEGSANEKPIERKKTVARVVKPGERATAVEAGLTRAQHTGVSAGQGTILDPKININQPTGVTDMPEIGYKIEDLKEPAEPIIQEDIITSNETIITGKKMGFFEKLLDDIANYIVSVT